MAIVDRCMNVDGLDAWRRSNRLRSKGEGVAEPTTTQHVNEKLDTVSAWLTGSFTLLLNHVIVCAVCLYTF